VKFSAVRVRYGHVRQGNGQVESCLVKVLYGRVVLGRVKAWCGLVWSGYGAVTWVDVVG